MCPLWQRWMAKEEVKEKLEMMVHFPTVHRLPPRLSPSTFSLSPSPHYLRDFYVALSSHVKTFLLKLNFLFHRNRQYCRAANFRVDLRVPLTRLQEQVSCDDVERTGQCTLQLTIWWVGGGRPSPLSLIATNPYAPAFQSPHSPDWFLLRFQKVRKSRSRHMCNLSKSMQQFFIISIFLEILFHRITIHFIKKWIIDFQFKINLRSQHMNKHI